MSPPRPRLVAVAPGEDGAAPRPVVAQAAEARRPRVRWLLAGLLAVALLLLAVQTGRVDGLTRQVEGLTSRLAAANGALAAFETRFERIRGVVSEVRSRVAELEALAASPPAGEIPDSEPR